MLLIASGPSPGATDLAAPLALRLSGDDRRMLAELKRRLPARLAEKFPCA